MWRCSASDDVGERPDITEIGEHLLLGGTGLVLVVESSEQIGHLGG